MDLHTPYSTVPFRMTLSDLAKYSMTRSVARSLRGLSATAELLVVNSRLPEMSIFQKNSTRLDI